MNLKKILKWLLIGLPLLLLLIAVVAGLIHMIYNYFPGKAIGEKKDWISFSSNILGSIISVILGIAIVEIHFKKEEDRINEATERYIFYYLSKIEKRINKVKEEFYTLLGKRVINIPKNEKRIISLSKEEEEELFLHFIKRPKNLKEADALYEIFFFTKSIQKTLFEIKRLAMKMTAINDRLKKIQEKKTNFCMGSRPRTRAITTLRNPIVLQTIEFISVYESDKKFLTMIYFNNIN